MTRCPFTVQLTVDDAEIAPSEAFSLLAARNHDTDPEPDREQRWVVGGLQAVHHRDPWHNRRRVRVAVSNISEPGKVPLLLCLTAFVVTFVVTRSITRTIRVGVGPFKDELSSGGLHVHHAVPGVIALVTGAFVAVGTSPESLWHLFAAVLVGAGSSLVLDEFALILRLRDVYWTSEGRVSVEMVSLAFACLGLTIVGVTPFGVDEMGGQELAARSSALAATLVTVGLVVVCVMKGKLRSGAVRRVRAWPGLGGCDPPGPSQLALGPPALRPGPPGEGGDPVGGVQRPVVPGVRSAERCHRGKAVEHRPVTDALARGGAPMAARSSNRRMPAYLTIGRGRPSVAWTAMASFGRDVRSPSRR